MQDFLSCHGAGPTRASPHPHSPIIVLHTVQILHFKIIFFPANSTNGHDEATTPITTTTTTPPPPNPEVCSICSKVFGKGSNQHNKLHIQKCVAAKEKKDQEEKERKETKEKERRKRKGTITNFFQRPAKEKRNETESSESSEGTVEVAEVVLGIEVVEIDSSERTSDSEVVLESSERG